MSSFPTILTTLRKERKLSQKVVAMDLNISQALLSHYEKGVRECSLDLLITIADYFGVSCDYLLGCTDARNRVVSNGSKVETICSCVSDIMFATNRHGDKKLTAAVEKYLILSLYNLTCSLSIKPPKNDKLKMKPNLATDISAIMKKNQLYNITKLSADLSKPKDTSPNILSVIEYSEKYLVDAVNEISKMTSL